MTSHFFDPDGLFGADYHTCFAFGAIARSGYPYAFGIKVKHVFRAYFETISVVLALTRVYFRKVHDKPFVSATGKVGPVDLRWGVPGPQPTHASRLRDSFPNWLLAECKRWYRIGHLAARDLELGCSLSRSLVIGTIYDDGFSRRVVLGGSWVKRTSVCLLRTMLTLWSLRVAGYLIHGVIIGLS